MARQIRSDLNLPTLRILLDPARTDFTQAVFQLVRGRGTPHEIARCGIRDLGLPEALVGMRPVVDEAPRVPPEVLEKLQMSLPEFGLSPMPPARSGWSSPAREAACT